MIPIPSGPPAGPARPDAAPELVAASLLTCPGGAELHLVARDGRRLRLATDEATGRALALGLWSALERSAAPPG